MVNDDLDKIAQKYNGVVPRLEPHWSESTPNTVYFVNDLFGVKLHQRYDDDKHVSVTILMEDDGVWFESGGLLDFSSYWIPDLTDLLEAVYGYLSTSYAFEPDAEGMGYRFK